jgi:hypothetical protein
MSVGAAFPPVDHSSLLFRRVLPAENLKRSGQHLRSTAKFLFNGRIWLA